VALNSTALSFMRIGGGAIAGSLLLVLSVGGVYLVTAGIYLLVILTTLLMRFEADGSAGRRSEAGLFADLAEGFRYIAGQPVLFVVTGLSLILFVFGFPYQQVFVPLLATKTLDLGDSGVGFLAGATGVGAFAGSLFVAWKSNIARPGLQLMINMLIFGGALVAISLQANVWLTALLLAVAGSMTVTYMAFTNGILLSNSRPDMHGRVMSLLSLDRGLIPLGAILAGALVEALGIRPGLFTLGAAIMAMSGLVLLLFGRRLAEIRSDGAVRGHGPSSPPREHGAAPDTGPARQELPRSL
jgi:hypothetical protein